MFLRCFSSCLHLRTSSEKSSRRLHNTVRYPVVFAVHDELVVGLDPFGLHQNALDLRRKYVDPPDDQHVVGTPAHTIHPDVRAPAYTRFGIERRHVPGAVADDREGLFGDRGEHQLAFLAVRQILPGDRVDDLGDEMILENVEALLGLEAFYGHPRSDHFTEAVNVECIQMELAFDFLTHLLGPGLGAENPRLEMQVLEIDSDFPGDFARCKA